MSVHQKALLTVARMWQDTVNTVFNDSLVQMLSYSQQKLCKPNEFIHYQPATVSYHETARKELVDTFLGEHLLQLDTDHEFHPDLLVRLWRLKQKYNSPVISGLYLQKIPPHVPVVRTVDRNNQVEQWQGWFEGDEVVGGTEPWLLVGGGCLLIDRWVFDTIKREMRQEPFDALTSPRKFSEDFAFCWRCKELGIPVHLAVNVEAHHLTQPGRIHARDYGLIRPRNEPGPTTDPAK